MPSTVPPDVADHDVEAPQLALPVARKYTVFAAGKLIPLLPFALPKRVPLIGAADPAIVISLKSTLMAVAKALQVKVLVTSTISDLKNVLHTAEALAKIVNVPVIVWLPEKVTRFNPADVLPVIVKLLNVFAPENVVLVDAAEEKIKLLNVFEPDITIMFDAVPVNVTL